MFGKILTFICLLYLPKFITKLIILNFLLLLNLPLYVADSHPNKHRETHKNDRIEHLKYCSRFFIIISCHRDRRYRSRKKYNNVIFERKKTSGKILRT